MVTTEFWEQGNFIARSTGLPGIPRVELPHPVAGTGTANMAKVAEEIVPAVLEALRGNA